MWQNNSYTTSILLIIICKSFSLTDTSSTWWMETFIIECCNCSHIVNISMIFIVKGSVILLNFSLYFNVTKKYHLILLYTIMVALFFMKLHPKMYFNAHSEVSKVGFVMNIWIWIEYVSYVSKHAFTQVFVFAKTKIFKYLFPLETHSPRSINAWCV